MSDLMPAGPELDVLVAEKVMKWEHLVVNYCGTPEETPRQVELSDWMDAVGINAVGEYFVDVARDFWVTVDDFTPSTDPGAAWIVVEKLRSEGWSYAIWGVPPFSSAMPGPLVAFRQGVDLVPELNELRLDGLAVNASAPTVPHAICLAALKAVGWEPSDD